MKNNDKTFLRDLPGDFGKDLTTPNHLSQKIASEQETRQSYLMYARATGCEQEMVSLFDRADKSLRNCTNEREREDMKKLFLVEIHKLLSTPLVINGQLIYGNHPIK